MNQEFLMKKVSVLMSTYKEPAEYIGKAIASILNQSYTDLQLIIVIDDPENVDAVTAITTYAAQDPRVIVYHNERNMGLVKSLNTALAIADGDYIARMDADDIAKPERISNEVRYLESQKADLVSSNVTDIDLNDHVINTTSGFPSSNDQIREFLRTNSCMPHPTWLGRKELFRRLDGYRDIDACEDYDFLVRAAVSGAKLANLKEPQLYYRINSQGISGTRKAKQKTCLYLLRKNYRDNRVTGMEELQDYLSSPEGKKKYNALERYYSMSAKLKTMKSNKAKYVLYGAFMFLVSSEARAVIRNEIIAAKIRSESR